MTSRRTRSAGLAHSRADAARRGAACGGSVALAGPIAFIGLMVPHIGRFLFGANHFWLIPFCMLGGALLLVAADIASRFILMPKAVPVGVTTALLGVPFLIYLARRRTE